MSEYTLSRIAKLCKDLKSQSLLKCVSAEKIEYTQSGYKTSNIPPERGWEPFCNVSRVKGYDCHFWFHSQITTEQCKGGVRPYLNIKSGRQGNVDAVNPQSIVYLNGEIVQGSDINHTEIPLESGKNYDVYVYFYIGMITSEVEFKLDVIYRDLQIESLYYDFFVPNEACRIYDKSGGEFSEVTAVLEQAANILSFRNIYDAEYYESIEKASDFLKEKLYCENGKKSPVVHCVGHTHIDVAWLWTYAQTKEKVQRSFATVLSLMKDYPEYKFMSSQPQLFEYLKEQAPEIYEKVKQRIKEGRFEVEGAMWLEADCNLISGESMVRQILFGKRFMKKEFNVDSKVLWLPDVFGYSAAMPQILKKSGVTDFVTSKISWNDTNTMPYDTFVWQGIDGSEVLSHFLTAQWLPADGKPVRVTSYVGRMSPQMILGSYKRYQQKEFNDHTVITFGYGDGGGGPTKDMLEYQRRMQYGLPGIPKTQTSTVAEWISAVRSNFFDNAQKLKRMPRWVGELYLELHRGTYTSIAKNKYNNRKSEAMLRTLELLSATDYLINGNDYPQNEINGIWKSVLLNQFHDVLPGSSIKEVYDDTDEIYRDVFKKGNNIIENRLKLLSENVSSQTGYLIYNSCGFDTAGIVRINGVTREVKAVPACGWTVVDFDEVKSSVIVDDRLIENDYYRLEFDDAGRIKTLFDKKCNRRIFRNGEFGNELQVFEDIPRDFDAWEISDYYEQKQWIIDDKADIEKVCDGDRKGLKITHRYMSSSITQTVYLYSTLRRIDFETEIDWKEKHQLLKAGFPLDINTDKATYEIQYGFIQRPTHRNTSWDSAKFEVCAHKWADVSEYGYGISLLNDCKYGHSCNNGVLKLTLLKSATYPNVNADREKHKFTYSLLPHSGDFRNSGVIKEAYVLNQPLLSIPVKANHGNIESTKSMCKTNMESVIIDSVKKSEDGNDIIIRMYESFGGKASGKLTTGFSFASAHECDLMENEEKAVSITGSTAELEFNPFEIKTVKLKLN